ncbi:MAG: hypothetical protein E7394_03155 [Ruminococcaceae bacterium]|nr:hypothetical protein [Oscillospiraceae bacterium]
MAVFRFSRGDTMIYFLSDLHSNINFSTLKNYLDIATDDDLLIILGDIGLKFEKTQQNREFDDYFLSINKKIAFIDGNHENFDYLKTFPEKEWNGGTAGRITENIIHLKRGNVYTINGKKFFVFGGCKSSDKWKKAGLWHPDEMPNDDELTLAYKNLKIHNYEVDYVLTHKYEKGSEYDELQKLTDFIDNNVKFNKWYSGHWHVNEKIDDKHIIVYDKLISVD